ncbi:MAG: DNA repair protein RadC [Prevotella sp.]|nr:DNA repair protein RadC [Candidatus Equicola stercoris]
MKVSINKWAEEDRPREKLELKGAEALSDAELLAILIGSGTPSMNAVDLTRDILNSCGDNLNTLGKMSIKELMLFNGIGKAKAITILAACELGKRRQVSQAEERRDMSNAERVYDLMHPLMQDLNKEEAWALYLDRKCRLVKKVRISTGGISGTMMDIRVMIKEAIMCNSTVMIAVHNHPSNNMQPSIEDDRVTARIKKACETMDINFLDHVIICDGGYYSYNDSGKL